MQTISKEERLAKYRSVSEQIAELYGSLETALFIKKTRIKFKIETDIFIDIVGDTILGLISYTEIKKHILTCGVNENDANHIEEEIKKFISGNKDTSSIPETNKTTKEKLELRPQMGSGQTTGAGEGQGEGMVRPLTREEVIRSIAPSRTMAKDIRTATEKGVLNEQKETPKEMFGCSPHEDEDGVESERG